MNESNTNVIRIPEITYTTDHEGQLLAHVPISSSDIPATLYAEDLQRILDAGWSSLWAYAGGKEKRRYVQVGCLNLEGIRRKQHIARLVANAAKGEIVRYLDGDTRNLRRENLYIERGRAFSDAHACQPRVGVPPLAAQARA